MSEGLHAHDRDYGAMHGARARAGAPILNLLYRTLSDWGVERHRSSGKVPLLPYHLSTQARSPTEGPSRCERDWHLPYHLILKTLLMLMLLLLLLLLLLMLMMMVVVDGAR